MAAPEIPIGPGARPAVELRKLENAVRAALKRQAGHVRSGRFSRPGAATRPTAPTPDRAPQDD